MDRKKLFNPDGSDKIQDRLLVGGNSTNLMNLNNVRFKWATSLWKKMRENFWVSETVDLTQDSKDYAKLSDEERSAFEGILSFLVFLDSLQSNNLPNISTYLTAPEVVACITEQAGQEVLHSTSYQYIIESVIPADRRDYIYDLYREDSVLLKRNRYIADIYQAFIDDSSFENFIKVLIANYCLESLYFYNGFIFFFLLNSRHLCSGVSDLIRLINRDENTHIAIFQNILNELREDVPNFKELVVSLFREAVEQEIEWSNHILGNNILGVSKGSIEAYTKYLCNKRLKSIGIAPIYPEFIENPYEHLENSSSSSGEKIKGNYFETTLSAYQQSTSVDGWNDF